MNPVVEVLMRRDGMTKDEAEDYLSEVRSELYDAINGTSCLSAEDVMYGELGLEMDYVYDVLLGF